MIGIACPNHPTLLLKTAIGFTSMAMPIASYSNRAATTLVPVAVAKNTKSVVDDGLRVALHSLD